eukprot:gene49993-62432_t
MGVKRGISSYEAQRLYAFLLAHIFDDRMKPREDSSIEGGAAPFLHKNYDLRDDAIKVEKVVEALVQRYMGRNREILRHPREDMCVREVRKRSLQGDVVGVIVQDTMGEVPYKVMSPCDTDWYKEDAVVLVSRAGNAGYARALKPSFG